MHFRYQVVKTPYPEPICGISETFGIRCYKSENGSLSLICEVDDISPEKSIVTALAEACNVVQLAPEHLWDAAYDVLP